MIELKDVVGWTLGSVGWALAVYQYWRNEINRRPHIVFPDGPMHGSREWKGILTVRNRGPWDITVVSIRATKPLGAKMERYAPASRGGGQVRSFEVDMLDWKLPAYASGEFPSRWGYFTVALPDGESEVEIEVAIDIKRDTWASKRLTKRHRTNRVNR